MTKYSISQVSAMLNIPKDTLRYYDKLNIVSPARAESKYRYYSEGDLTSLMYVQAMKYAGFSLEEIKRVMHNMTGDISNKNDTLKLLEEKEADTLAKIQHFTKIVGLLRETKELIISANELCDFSKMDKLIKSVYGSINNNIFEDDYNE